MISLSWIRGLNYYISESFCPFWWRILDSLSFLGVFLYGRLFKTIPGDALPPWPRGCTIISYSTYIRSYWIIYQHHPQISTGYPPTPHQSPTSSSNQLPLSPMTPTMPEYRPTISISWAWSFGVAASRITSGANSMESIRVHLYHTRTHPHSHPHTHLSHSFSLYTFLIIFVFHLFSRSPTPYQLPIITKITLF